MERKSHKETENEKEKKGKPEREAEKKIFVYIRNTKLRKAKLPSLEPFDHIHSKIMNLFLLKVCPQISKYWYHDNGKKYLKKILFQPKFFVYISSSYS